MFEKLTPAEKRAFAIKLLKEHLVEIKSELREPNELYVLEVVISEMKKKKEDKTAEIVMAEYLMFTLRQKLALITEIKEQIKTLESDDDINKMA